MKEIKTLNDKIKELEEKIDWFYSDDFDLEEAVANYKVAIKMAKDLQKELTELRNEVEVLAKDFSK